MRDFQEFIDKKIAVESTDEFMRLCEDEGLLWNSGKKPTEQKIHPYITFRANGDDAISGDCLDYFKRKGYQIVTAAEFLPKTPTIEIFQSKQTVVCLKKQDGKVVAVGKAKCNPEDEFNFDYGAKLALTRLWTDINQRNHRDVLKSLADAKDKKENGIKTLKNGMRIKKQDSYEVGDTVLIKKKPDRNYGKEHYGKTSKIKEIKPNCFSTNGYVLDIDSKYIWFDRDIKGKVI